MKLKKILSLFAAMTIISISNTNVAYASETFSTPQQSTTLVSSSAELTKPVINKVSKSSSYVKLSWSKVKGASGYILYRKTNKGWSKIKTIRGENNHSYKIEGLNSRTKYSFILRAFQKYGEKNRYGKFSKPVTLKTKYGLGANNYTQKYLSVNINRNIWDAKEDYPFFGKGISFGYNKTRNYINEDWIEYMAGGSVSAEKINKERRSMTLEDFVDQFIEDQKSMRYPVNYSVKYRKKYGTRCAFLTRQKSDNTSIRIMAYKNGYLYSIYYYYPKAEKNIYRAKILKVVNSVKFS